MENALEQTRPGTKKLLQEVRKRILRERGPVVTYGKLDSVKWKAWYDEIKKEEDDLRHSTISKERLAKDLGVVLEEKAEGEARNMVRNTASGPTGGLEAFMKLYAWYSRISGTGMAERRS